MDAGETRRRRTCSGCCRKELNMNEFLSVTHVMGSLLRSFRGIEPTSNASGQVSAQDASCNVGERKGALNIHTAIHGCTKSVNGVVSCETDEVNVVNAPWRTQSSDTPTFREGRKGKSAGQSEPFARNTLWMSSDVGVAQFLGCSSTAQWDQRARSA